MTTTKLIAMIPVAAGMLCLAGHAMAQTRTTRDTTTAYGARLDAKGAPADLNPNRYNNRINNRLDTRLSLRLERYRPDSVGDPTAAFAKPVTDNSRLGTSTTLPHGPHAEPTRPSEMATRPQNPDSQD